MGTISSAIALVRSPGSYIAANKDSPATVNGIMLRYVAVLALIPFFATLIGDLWYYNLFLPFGFVGSFTLYSVVSGILVYILDVAAVYVIAIVIRMLAPTFSSAVDEIKSLKLASYIYTPVFLIAVLDLYPPLSSLTFLGVLYGLYILYIGLAPVLSTPKDKVIPYVVGIVIAAFVVFFIIGFIVGVVTGAIFFSSLRYFY